MKAPEKIYVDSKAIGNDISTTVHTKRQDYPTCTEYIRTDAVIEKSCEWIEHNNENGGCSFDGWRKDFIKFLESEL